MRNSALWNQHYLDCEDVIVEHIHVFNHCNGNNDGIDIDGCRRFILSDSVIDSDDDGIVLKSTGLAPCEDVVINNCIVSSFANAINVAPNRPEDIRILSFLIVLLNRVAIKGTAL